MAFIEVPPRLMCLRCDHRWRPRGGHKVVNGKAEVRICPKCKSPYWDRKREEVRETVKN